MRNPNKLREQPRNRIPRSWALLVSLGLMSTIMPLAQADNQNYLEGVSNPIEGEDTALVYSGVDASFYGGAIIKIGGPEGCFTSGASNNKVFLTLAGFPDIMPFQLELSSDDKAKSNINTEHDGGENSILQYTLPSVKEIMMLENDDQVDALEETVSMHVSVGNDDGIVCGCKSNDLSDCEIKFKKGESPTLYEVMPPVTYCGSEVTIRYDPKDFTQNSNIYKNSNYDTEFTDFKIGTQTVDFFSGQQGRHKSALQNMNDIRDTYITGKCNQETKPNKGDVAMNWQNGAALHVDFNLEHCDIWGDNCYRVKNLPAIETISDHWGWNTGHMQIDVKGCGFDFNGGQKIAATVGGRRCGVMPNKSRRMNKDGNVGFACRTISSEITAAGGLYVGQHGVRWQDHNYNQKGKTLVNINQKIRADAFKPNIEQTPITDSCHGNRWKAWFQAPLNGIYKFHIAGDDKLKLQFANTPDQIDDTTEILWQGKSMAGCWNKQRGWTEFRDWFMGPKICGNKQISEEITLVKDKHYYIQLDHANTGCGPTHASLGVEITPSVEEEANKPSEEVLMRRLKRRYTRQVKRLSARFQDQHFDTTEFTVDQTDPADVGTFKLYFSSPSYPLTASQFISSQATAGEVRTAVEADYCLKRHKSYCEVEIIRYDAQGEEIQESDTTTEVVKRKYNIVMLKSLENQSVSTVMAIRECPATCDLGMSNAKITGQHITTSTPPLRGMYTIKCTDGDGDVRYTRSMKFNTNQKWVRRYLMEDCELNEKLEIYSNEGDKSDYKDNGLNFMLRFTDSDNKSLDNGAFEIIIGELENVGIVSETEEVVPLSSKIFYENIPFEMLKTVETRPQVIASVGGLPAVCKNLNCDYEYRNATAEITSWIYNPSTRELIVRGTGFPVSDPDNQISYIRIGRRNCKGWWLPGSTTETELRCTLAAQPRCGQTSPLVVTRRGRIPVNAGQPPTEVDCAITSIESPPVLNVNGGDVIKWFGTSFPNDENEENDEDEVADDIQIIFQNGGSTKCIYDATLSATVDEEPEKLVCVTQPFDSEDDANTVGLTASVHINGYTCAQAGISFDVGNNKPTIESIGPLSVSPVLKQRIDIVLSGGSLASIATTKSDWTVFLHKVGDDSFVPKEVRVVEYDHTTLTVSIMFGGAWSAEYQLYVHHATIGLFLNEGINLHVGSGVTSVSTMRGSAYGGTVIKIQGYNFGSLITDNPVNIFHHFEKLNVPCHVQTSTPTEITCKIARRRIPYVLWHNTQDADNTGRGYNKNAEVVVYLKTSEEAVCADSVCRGFFFVSEQDFQYTGRSLGGDLLDKIPTITKLTSEWSSNQNKWKLRFTGERFTGGCYDVTFDVATASQTCNSVSATEAVFTIEDLPAPLSSGELVFTVGAPHNHAAVSAGLTLEPKFVSVTPQDGSVGGTTIFLNVQGVGVWDTVDVKNSDGFSICSSASVVSYGRVKCLTNAGKITNTQLKISVGAATHECVSSNCYYQQQLGGAQSPNVTIANVTDTTIEFTGTNFKTQTSGHSVRVVYNGFEPDSIIVHSEVSITATWAKGVPSSVSSNTVELSFEDTTTSVRYFATYIEGLEVTNPFAFTQATTGLECSLAGGCKYEIATKNLATNLRSGENNHISFCEEKCLFSEELSTADNTVCHLAPIQTLNRQLKPDRKRRWRHRIIPHQVTSSGSVTDHDNLFDQDIATQASENTAENCDITMNIKPGHVAELKRVRIYYAKTVPRDAIRNNLVFEGSNDGSTWDQLLDYGSRTHWGWNHRLFEEDKPNEETEEEDDVIPLPKYAMYRFVGTASGACQISEIHLTGKVLKTDINAEGVSSEPISFDCPPMLHLEGMTESLDLDISTDTTDKKVTFLASKTGVITSVEPRFGSVVGNEAIVFTGTELSTTITDYSIVIDGVDCAVTMATSTTVTCTTGARPGYVETSLVMTMVGRGVVQTEGVVYTYANFWSAPETWGGEFAPVDGESIHIPRGLNLLVDIDVSPLLNVVIVEGTLIMAPSTDPLHHREFRSKYIIVEGGRFEAGTPAFPYDSKLTITMNAKLEDPMLPIYGNNVLAATDDSQVDIVGKDVGRSWGLMSQSANAGDTVLHLTVERNWFRHHWSVGAQIVIATTSYNNSETEVRTILSIAGTERDPILTIDTPLTYNHYSAIQTFGSDSIDTRCEVGLLTRNVVFRGEEQYAKSNKYGAAMFFHGKGDETIRAQIHNVELVHVGQNFREGSNPINFMVRGDARFSFIFKNSIWNSYNRGVVVHGTSQLRIKENVLYNNYGHNIMLASGQERGTKMHYNLVLNTKRSFSGLNSDTTPAAFWISNPWNNLRWNHVAGSDSYGFWYDLQKHPIGVWAWNPNRCPSRERIGIFIGNTAHSQTYGLRVPDYTPIARWWEACEELQYDSTVAEGANPFHSPLIFTAKFRQFTGFKHTRNSAIAGQVGDVRFENFKTTDDILAGIEFEKTDQSSDNRAQVKNSVTIGKSANPEGVALLDAASPHGIIGARTENFTIDGCKFHNYNWNSAAALGDCSHCYNPRTSDSGARTITVKNLVFDDATVTRRIRYQSRHNGIFYDVDGSLTGMEAKTWAVAYKQHNEWATECTKQDEKWGNGHLCDSTVQVRRVIFTGYQPWYNFRGQHLKVIRWDSNMTELATEESIDAWKGDSINYSIQGAYTAVPFVTGHRYKIHFGNWGVNWKNMRVELSDRWVSTDKNIHIVHNYTDIRVDYGAKLGNYVLDGDNTLPTGTNVNSDSWTTGMWRFDNETSKTFEFALTGQNITGAEYYRQNQVLSFTGHRCIGVCLVETSEVGGAGVELETEPRYWSQATNWPNETFPTVGEDVVIQASWNMIYDLNETSEYNVVFNMVTVKGILTFQDGPTIGEDTTIINRHFKCKHLLIRNGTLNIGAANVEEETNWFKHRATITLYGERESQNMVYDSAIHAGNKILANVGTVNMFGKPRTQTHIRLSRTIQAGSTQLWLQVDLDIVAGDQITLTASSFDASQTETVVVATYNASTGLVVLVSGCKYTHYGSADNSPDFNGVDIRGEALLLSRNIVIRGDRADNVWGGQIVTSDTIEMTPSGIKQLFGVMNMHNVEVYHCSQIDTMQAAIRFEGALGGQSVVHQSTFHDGFGWGMHIVDSANIVISENTIVNFQPIGVALWAVQNIKFTKNFVSGITSRDLFKNNKVSADIEAGVSICAYRGSGKCTNIEVTDNVVAGAKFAGFVAYGHGCGVTNSNSFRNNVAHSIDGNGAIVSPDPTVSDHRTCFEASYFAAYKCTEQGIFSYASSAKATFHHMTMMDNVRGFSLFTGVEADEINIELNDNFIHGELPIGDCLEGSSDCIAHAKFGMMAPYASASGKSAHEGSRANLPMDKIGSYAAWGAFKVFARRNTFKNFAKTTKLGQKQHVIGIAETMSDDIPQMIWQDTKFDNVDSDAISYIPAPQQAWAVKEMCGDFPCSGPLNVLFRFFTNTFVGVTKPNAEWFTSSFSIIANNEGFAKHVGRNCKLFEASNAYVCNQAQDNLAILKFESLDDNAMDRAYQPIFLMQQGTGIKNIINAQMDHSFSGFYKGQKRMARFPSIVDANAADAVYDLQYTLTAPKKQRFKLVGQKENTGMILRIQYHEANTYQVRLPKGTIKHYNGWDNNAKSVRPINKRVCGENIYHPEQRVLEVWVSNNCEFTVEPRNVIQAKVRLQWSIKDFYAAGGANTFADRIAGALGIHASEIKIVSVYEGSLIAIYHIVSLVEDTVALAQIAETQRRLMATNAFDLGAPILDFNADSTDVVTDGTVTLSGYSPIVITATATNTAGYTGASSGSTSYMGTIYTNTHQSFNAKDGYNPDYTIPDIGVVREQRMGINSADESFLGNELQEQVIFKQVGKKENSDPIVLIIVTVILTTVTLLLVRFVYNQFTKEKDTKEKFAQDRQRFEQSEELPMARLPTKQQAKSGFSDVTPSKHPLNQDETIKEDEEKQFDAKQDFGIFKERQAAKMNKADNVRESIDSLVNEEKPTRVIKQNSGKSLLVNGKQPQNSSSNESLENIEQDDVGVKK